MHIGWGDSAPPRCLEGMQPCVSMIHFGMWAWEAHEDTVLSGEGCVCVAPSNGWWWYNWYTVHGVQTIERCRVACVPLCALL